MTVKWFFFARPAKEKLKIKLFSVVRPVEGKLTIK